MDFQPYIDRILESENLTGNLVDADARRLLEWSLAQLPRLLQGSEDTDLANETTNALMKVMRQVNRIASGLPAGTPDDVLPELESLFCLAAPLFDQLQEAIDQDLHSYAAILYPLIPSQAVDYLTHLLTPRAQAANPPAVETDESDLNYLSNT